VLWPVDHAGIAGATGARCGTLSSLSEITVPVADDQGRVGRADLQTPKLTVPRLGRHVPPACIAIGFPPAAPPPPRRTRRHPFARNTRPPDSPTRPGKKSKSECRRGASRFRLIVIVQSREECIDRTHREHFASGHAGTRIQQDAAGRSTDNSHVDCPQPARAETLLVAPSGIM
jgi:hypothetical protein